MTPIKSILLSLSLLGLAAAAAEAYPSRSQPSKPSFDRPAALAQAPAQQQVASQRKAHWQARKAKKLARFDSNGNGQIDPAERMEIKRQRFAKLDGNGDGFLTLDELKAAKQARKARRMQARQARGKVHPPGQGHPGKASKRAGKGKKRNPAARFQRIDADNNGYISWEEFSQKQRFHKGKGRMGRGARR